MGDWFLLTMVRRNLDDRQFTSWIKEVEERVCEKESVKRERDRAKRERNGHSWAHRHGLRERKVTLGTLEDELEGDVPKAEKESTGSMDSRTESDP